MFSVAKALCPIDFTAASDVALDAALAIAKAAGAELYLLHVIEGPAPAPRPGFDASAAVSARDAVRARMLGMLEERHCELEPHVLVTDGIPAEEILRLEEIFGIELIVLAPHGRPTLGKILSGSVSDKVARAARAHVLIVKTGTLSGNVADPPA